MPLTNFQAYSTSITADFLNKVDVATISAIGDGSNTPTTPTQVVANLGLSSSTGSNQIGFNQGLTGSTTTTVQSVLRETVSIKKFGAVGDGVTDDSTAIQTALNSGAGYVIAPYSSSGYRCSTGITIPGGVTFDMKGCNPGNPTLGNKLVFDLGVPTCVTLNGVANNFPAQIKEAKIVRAAGTIPAGSIGLLNKYTGASNISHIGIFGHSICYMEQNDQTSFGINAMVSNMYTGNCTDSHIVIDSWPESRFSQCRFGLNGAFDQNCNSFIRVQGGSTTNAANGPNTLSMTNCQFNQGRNTAAAWLNFANQTVAAISDIALWQFDNCYIETVSAGVTSDATWPSLSRFQFTNSTFNMNSTVPFWNLNAATINNNCLISNSNIFGRFTVAPTNQFNFLTVNGNIFSGAVSITGVSNSTINFVGNTYNNGLTLAGSFGGPSSLIGESVTGGAFTNTATGISTLLENGNFVTNNITATQGVASVRYSINPGGHLLIANTTLTIASGFGTGASIVNKNGTACFQINVGTGGTASSGVITFPAALNGWMVTVSYNGPSANMNTYAVMTSTTQVTLTNQTSSTGATVAWPSGTVLNCTAFAL